MNLRLVRRAPRYFVGGNTSPDAAVTNRQPRLTSPRATALAIGIQNQGNHLLLPAPGLRSLQLHVRAF